jgi:parvulin-like peptidyl-prolyl isomerase
MPSPREIQKEYANNIDSFKSPESRDIGLITVYLGDYKKNPEKGKKIIKNIEDGLFSGQDFSQLAVRYSDGAKAQEGGRQGWIQKKDLAEDIAKVAFSLEPSRHSGPHQMGDLVFFTKCFDVKPASTQPLSDVRNQIHQKLYQRKRDQVKNKKINALKRKCHIERLPPEAYIAYRRSLSKPQPRQP